LLQLHDQVSCIITGQNWVTQSATEPHVTAINDDMSLLLMLNSTRWGHNGIDEVQMCLQGCVWSASRWQAYACSLLPRNTAG